MSRVRRQFQRVLVLGALSACSTRRVAGAIPEPWAKLHLPMENLDSVRAETDEGHFSADYRGCTAEQLLKRVETALVDAGYKRTCSQFEGVVRGYTKGPATLLVKVDSLGPVQALSVGNEQGSDRLLFGLCFKGYRPE
jgi:hypothetical protein